MDFSIDKIHAWILYTCSLCVKGLIINPMTNQGVSVICLDQGEPLQLDNPFDPEKASSTKFVLLEWLKKTNTSDPGESLMHMGKDKAATVNMKRVSSYQFWGLQVSPVKYEDSGIYEATMLTTSSVGESVQVQVIVASPPKLASKSLEVKIEKNGIDKTVTCGQVESLGVPPVALTLQSGNGSVLDSDFSNGFLLVQLDSKTETGKFYCGIEESSPAKNCIPHTDLSRWDSSLQIGKSTSAADTTGIVAGVAVAIVLLFIIIVVILVVVKRRRRDRDDAYNAKTEEAKARATMPLSTQTDDEEEHDLPSKAPYLPSKQSSATPYMVTGFKLIDSNQSSGNHYDSTLGSYSQDQNRQIYKQPPMVKPEEDEDIDLADSHYHKKDQNRNLNQSLQSNNSSDKKSNQQPPVPMKRNIKNITASSEGLNLTNNSESSGRDGSNVGTLV